jgi:hypothetical protein
MTAWKNVEYDFAKNGDIELPEGAPFDGKPVLIKTNTGVVEAWWCVGEWSVETPVSPREYEGWFWVCYDDQFQVELDEAKAWMPIPA